MLMLALFQFYTKLIHAEEGPTYKTIIWDDKYPNFCLEMTRFSEIEIIYFRNFHTDAKICENFECWPITDCTNTWLFAKFNK